MRIVLTQSEAEEIIKAEITRRVAGSQMRAGYASIFTYTDGSIGIKTELHMREIVRRKPKRS